MRAQSGSLDHQPRGFGGASSPHNCARVALRHRGSLQALQSAPHPCTTISAPASLAPSHAAGVIQHPRACAEASSRQTQGASQPPLQGGGLAVTKTRAAQAPEEVAYELLAAWLALCFCSAFLYSATLFQMDAAWPFSGLSKLGSARAESTRRISQRPSERGRVRVATHRATGARQWLKGACSAAPPSKL